MKKKNALRIKKYLNRGLRSSKTTLKAANWINWQNTACINYRPGGYCDAFLEDEEGYRIHEPMPKPSTEGWNGKLRLCATYGIYEEEVHFGGTFFICGIKHIKAYGEVRHVFNEDVYYWKKS